jgi:hypothetical protein
VVSLRSTTGYKLASLRDQDDQGIELARVIARNKVERRVLWVHPKHSASQLPGGRSPHLGGAAAPSCPADSCPQWAMAVEKHCRKDLLQGPEGGLSSSFDSLSILPRFFYLPPYPGNRPALTE